MIRKNDFQYLVDHINVKLAGWKRNNLSFAGRVTLAKSVIEVMPLYPIMTNKIHKAVIEEINCMYRKFILGDTPEHRKLYDVSWNAITKPKDQGGL